MGEHTRAMRKQNVAIAIALVMLVMLAGCAGRSGHALAERLSKLPDELSRGGVVNVSIEERSSARGAALRTVQRAGAGASQSPILAAGPRIEYAARADQRAYRAEIIATAATGPGRSLAVFDGPITYVLRSTAADGGPRFGAVNLATASPPVVVNLPPIFPLNPAVLTGLLRGILTGGLRHPVAGSLNGEAVTRYQAAFDREKAVRQLDGQQQAVFRRILAAKGVTATVLRGEVWVDHRGALRRMVVNLAQPTVRANLRFETRVALTFGAREPQGSVAVPARAAVAVNDSPTQLADAVRSLVPTANRLP